MLRRAFLQIAGGALTALRHPELSAQASTPQNAAAAQNAVPTRRPPVRAIVLRTADLEVVLDREHGLPYEFRLRRNGARILGEHSGKPIVATICNHATRKVFDAELRCLSAKRTAATADFLFA